MTKNLVDGIYRLLHIEYDPKNGNHYLLKDRERHSIVHFWDQDKTLRLCFILNGSILEKSVVNGSAHLCVLCEGKKEYYFFDSNKSLFVKSRNK